MDVAIAGGHGKIALELTRLLAGRGDRVRSLIRNPDHAAEVREAGGEPVACDLEAVEVDELAGAIEGADAVVFAAGAGAGSGAARKDAMDYGGAAKLIAAAERAGIRRYVMVSAMGAASPPPEPEGDVFGAYLRAKARADRELQRSGLDYTIVRPGILTDDPPTGKVRVGANLDRGRIPRADVARVLQAVLDQPAISGSTFDLVSGEDEVDAALASLAA